MLEKIVAFSNAHLPYWMMFWMFLAACAFINDRRLKRKGDTRGSHLFGILGYALLLAGQAPFIRYLNIHEHGALVAIIEGSLVLAALLFPVYLWAYFRRPRPPS